MLSKQQTTAEAAIFHKTRLMAVDRAAPIIPRVGIRVTFKATFIKSAIIRIMFSVFCLPVMFKKIAEGPEIELKS